MGQASNKCYVPSKERFLQEQNLQNNNNEEIVKVDTNVVCIGFNILQQNMQNLLQMGDPVFCSKCQVNLNKNSKIVKNQENNQQTWTCEFCGTKNEINIEQEEVPKNEDILYLQESMSQINAQNQNQEMKDSYIIFCMDLSGSMNTTTQVQAESQIQSQANKQFEDELENMKEFMTPEEIQYYKQHNKKYNKNYYVSRKQCVVAAIQTQLLELQKNQPNVKIGIVTFNNDVCILGDAGQAPTIIAGDKLYNYEMCYNIGKQALQDNLKLPISQSYNNIISSFDKLQADGQTALGPALLASIGIASEVKNASTQVILCTDGLSNIGLGALDQQLKLQESEAFYNQVQQLAQDHQIKISLITMKGEECQIGILGKISDATSGYINRINPEDMQKDFGKIIENEIIATNVVLKVHLHQGLYFRNEDDNLLNESKSVMTKNVGNVTITSEVTFEYDIKKFDELEKNHIDIFGLTELPFQAQIFYTIPTGRYVRVISRSQEICRNKAEAEQDVKFAILAQHAQKTAAKLAINKNYDKASLNVNNWNQYINKVSAENNYDVESVQKINSEAEKLNNAIQIYSKKDQLKEIQEEEAPQMQQQEHEEEEKKISYKNRKMLNIKKPNQQILNEQKMMEQQQQQDKKSQQIDMVEDAALMIFQANQKSHQDYEGEQK